jgi:hypothetical protein
MLTAVRGAARSVAVYRFLLRGYPRRFRAAYEDAIVEAFCLELERVRRRSSAVALAAFWVFMGADLVSGVAMTQRWEAWRRIAYSARLLRGSTGFTAAAATLAMVSVWAWSRFATYVMHATYATGRTRDATLTFAVAALHALLIWGLACVVAALCARRVARSPASGPAIGGKRYTSVRRARLVARLASISAAAFAVATLSEARRGRFQNALVNPAISPVYWIALALTLLGIVGMYFAIGGWLHLRDAS